MITIVALFVGVIFGAGVILYLVRHNKMDAKKAADELAAIAAKAKQNGP